MTKQTEAPNFITIKHEGKKVDYVRIGSDGQTKADRYDLIAAILDLQDVDKSRDLADMISANYLSAMGGTDSRVDDFHLIQGVVEGEFDNLDWREVIDD